MRVASEGTRRDQKGPRDETQQEGGSHRGPTPAVLVSHRVVDPNTREQVYGSEW